MWSRGAGRGIDVWVWFMGVGSGYMVGGLNFACWNGSANVDVNRND